MWRQHPDPQNTTPSIHPNLKKIFNPFDILKPEKLPINGSLIDLSVPNEANSINPIKSPTTKGFSHIDLLENIFVTPQLVSNQSKNERNIDFEDFFNKLESGSQCDWTNTNAKAAQVEFCREDNRVSSYTNQIAAISHENKKNPVLEIDSLFDKIVKNDRRNSKYESLSIQNDYEHNIVEEDLIEEVLLDKTLEKITLSDHISTDFRAQVKILSTPNINNVFEHNGLGNHKPNNDSKLKTVNDVNNVLKETIKDPELQRKVLPKPNILVLNKELTTNNDFNIRKYQNQVLHSNIESSSKSNKHEQNPTTFNFIDLKSLLDVASLRNYTNNLQESANRKFAIKEKPIDPEKLLKDNQKCMIKEAKHFAKYNMPCNDPNKNKFTPGPSYEEKLIALPHILDRLNKQKKAFDYKNNMPRRLILDEGAKRRNDVTQITDLYPVSLKEDCNKGRLAAYEIGKKFEYFVNKGSYP